MRFVTFLSSQNQQRVGLLDSGSVIDIQEGLQWLGVKTANSLDILEIIRSQ